MGFRLVIAQGREQGRQFSYDGSSAEIRVGRTSENDIVLYDSGVSRGHLRLYQRDGRCFVEDLGSANGTKVNGLKISGPSELTSGDTITVGTVVFSFALVEGGGGSAGASTELLDASALAKAFVALDETASQQERERMEHEATAALDDAEGPELEAWRNRHQQPPAQALSPELEDAKALLRQVAGPLARAPAANAPPPEPPAPSAPNPELVPTLALRPSPEQLAALRAPPPLTPSEVEGRAKVDVRRGPSTSLGENGADDTAPSHAPPPPAPPRDTDTQPSRELPPVAEQETRLRNAVARAPSVSELETVRKLPVVAAFDETSPQSPRALAVAPDPDRRDADATAPQPAPPSVAERARRRRSFGDSLGGQLRFLWAELPPNVRQALVFSGAALCVAALLLLLWPRGTGAAGPEPELLARAPVEASFGLGEGVTWEHPDHKTFFVDLVAPTRALVVVHYRARDISDGEVVIWLNGGQVGQVPADTAELTSPELEQVLPLSRLRRNARNELVFDSTHNPPESESWRVEGLWAEVVPLPELPTAELDRTAREYFQRGQEFERLHEVGPDNLFKAWRSYRDAWLSFEALETKPELYSVVQLKMNDLRVRLDALCSRLMLDAERAMRLKNRKKARTTLEDVPRYFPTPEHRCHNLALEKLALYGL